MVSLGAAILVALGMAQIWPDHLNASHSPWAFVEAAAGGALVAVIAITALALERRRHRSRGMVVKARPRPVRVWQEGHLVWEDTRYYVPSGPHSTPKALYDELPEVMFHTESHDVVPTRRVAVPARAS